MNLQDIMKVYIAKGYPILMNNKPNIFGIRNCNNITDAFDDYIGIFWGEQEMDNFVIFEATTDPGKFYAENPIDGKRTAMMVPGYHKDVYALGLHQGKADHECLRQVKDIAFYQDTDRNFEIDINAPIKWQSIGANIHGTRPDLEAWRVGKFSAACQVIKTWNSFQTFMNVCKASKEKFFSYALLEKKDF